MKDISQDDLKNKLKLVAKKSKNHKSRIVIGDKVIGGEKPTIIAGPCRVESMEQMTKIAESLKKNNIDFLRAGVYKPCTFPYANAGMGLEGLKILQKIKKKYDLNTVTEIMNSSQIKEAVDYIDIIQIGARNMQNYDFLVDIAETGKPILLKRHPGASLREFLGAAEWLMAHGNEKVILCERGVAVPYTHDPNARWALDITVVPAVKRYTHLPIILDPSHSAGVRDYVPSLSRAAIAAGADGLLIEIHPEPDKAHSDSLQHIDLRTFEELVADLNAIHKSIKKS